MFRRLFFNLAYLQKPVWDAGISPGELMEFIETHNPGKALDMGCGTGTNVITLAKHGWQVTGVDFSGRAIRAARQKARANQVEARLVHEDVTRFSDIPGTYDLILDMGCFHSLPAGSHQGYIANIDQLLAEDGTYLLYTFIKSETDTAGPGVTADELESFKQKFQIVNRKDGTERGIRPSAWLTIRKKA